MDTSSSLWFTLWSTPCGVQFLGFVLFLCGSCSKMHHVMYLSLWHHKSSFTGLKKSPAFLLFTSRPFPLSPTHPQIRMRLFKLFIYFAVLGLHCCMGFSLVAAGGDYSLVAVHGLLIVGASLVRIPGSRAFRLQ